MIYFVQVVNKLADNFIKKINSNLTISTLKIGCPKFSKKLCQISLQNISNLFYYNFIKKIVYRKTSLKRRKIFTIYIMIYK